HCARTLLLAITSRAPILIGFLFSASANRLSQLGGNFSVRPPNSSTSFRESLRDVHAIWSCRRFRPGLEMIASLPPESACKMFSCALSQRGSAIFRHRYITSGSASSARFITALLAVVGLHVTLRSKRRLERLTSA